MAISGRLGRTVVAALALALVSGRASSVEQLIDALWGDVPPATARQQVHIQVSKLRAALTRAGASAVVCTEPSGYRLRAAQVDVGDVVRLQEEARADADAGHPDEAAAKFRTALERWSGTPLGGASAHLAAARIPGLDELWLCLVEERIDAELACGHAARLVPELTGLVRDHPLREGLHHRRMLALYRAGRRADALAAFREARRVLRDELGMDPPRELVDLEEEVLASGSSGTGGSCRVRPAQLPPLATGFAGRADELAALAAVLGRPSEAPRVALVTGMPGIGKTALAVRAGAAAEFPDGQLYADLRGANVRPARPAEVLGGFLRALGVRARAMPADLAGRIAEFRSRTAGRRMLVMLDNAGAAEQVEPLLVAEPGCATVVTSRFVLPELEAAVRVPVGPLPDDDAHNVLENVAGAARLADREAAAMIVKTCGGVPLALRIAGGQLATFPSMEAAEVAARLSNGPGPEESLRRLDRPARRALSLLAMIDCSTMPSWPLAPLLGVTADRAARLAARLASLHLLEPAEPGRYRMHDRVRAACRGPEPEDAAVERLVAWTTALVAGGSGRLTRADVDVVLAVLELVVERGATGRAAVLLVGLRVPLIRFDLVDRGARIAARLERMAGRDVVTLVSARLVAATARLDHGRHGEVVRMLDAVRPVLCEVDPVLRAELLATLAQAADPCRRALDTEWIGRLSQDRHVRFR
ncbi:MAG: BTAD domain-containing putative transcriptional regulator [Labedaea sp.]